MNAQQQREMEQNLGLHTFELTDRKGNPHHYTTYLHEGMASLSFCLRVARAGGVPLARFIESNLGLFVRSFLAGGLEGLSGKKLREVFLNIIQGTGTGGEKLELNLALAVEDVVDVLLEMQSSGLIVDLFSKTQRDGAYLTEAYLNTAYTGNPAEMRNAMIEIIAENGFLDFLIGGWGEETPSTQPPTINTPPTSTGSDGSMGSSIESQVPGTTT